MKTRIFGVTSLSALLLTLTFGTLTARAAEISKDHAQAQAAAQKAAEDWLALIDQAKYAQSWDESAALFRDAVTKDAWGAAVSGVRGQVGALKSRHLKGAQYTTDLPGAPEGEYVVLQYDAVFAARPAVETITPMLDKDGHWRVSGYYVR